MKGRTESGVSGIRAGSNPNWQELSGAEQSTAVVDEPKK